MKDKDRKKNNGKFQRKKHKLGFFLIISTLFLISLNCNTNIIKHTESKTLKTSGIWATLDLIDVFGVNNSRHPHDSTIQIYGRLYNRITDEGKAGFIIALKINSILYPSINDDTDISGYFLINYVVDSALDVYFSHIIEAEVIDPTPDNVEYRTHLLIFTNTASYFNVQDPPSASLHGEFFNFEGYLNFQSGTGIPNKLVSYYWYDGSNIVDSNIIFTDSSGKIPYNNIFIPFVPQDDLILKLNFSDYPYVDYSEIIVSNTKIFSDISCVWNLPSTITENNDLNIAGTLISSTDSNLKINNRNIEIFYNATYIGTDTTDNNGDFSFIYSLPIGVGVSSIRIVLGGTGIDTIRYIDVEAETPSAPIPPGQTPYLLFLTIFLPILASIIIGLAIYGYRYYKKQDKLSRVVNLPLESKIINLKILKDSGRLEESLSYLFNAIYMDLINAKYGRSRNVNETIRDFAIVSVKDLKLNPTTIYPFIQKIEEIIYAKPFQIGENDFYKTIELFSPIYFQLTGYNFILNF
ncbi:MAG: hypothetical protein ACFFEO_03480 [Candidatus Thorarchaeota archaeon]